MHFKDIHGRRCEDTVLVQAGPADFVAVLLSHVWQIETDIRLGDITRKYF